MGRPYSLDLRERVVAAMTAGMSGQKAAQHFTVGIIKQASEASAR